MEVYTTYLFGNWLSNKIMKGERYGEKVNKICTCIISSI
jgi:hypothetical protein